MMPVAVAAVAVPLHTAVKYVAGAYVVFVVVIFVYVAIMANRLRQTEHDLVQLRRDLEAHRAAEDSSQVEHVR